MNRTLTVSAFALVAAAASVGGASAEVSTSGQFAAQTGEGVYSTLCQGCHMPDAKGASGAGAYPSLAANKRLASSAYPAIIVLRGHKAMPPFGPNLSDGQISGVVNYLRTHFGNAYKDSITPGTVKALREAGPKPSGKTTEAG